MDDNVEGTVIVARWFGGVMLGPVRFEHIRTAAREALWLWRRESEDREEGKKRVKREEEDREEMERLVRELPERDHSIIVLRGLLAGLSEGGAVHEPREREGAALAEKMDKVGVRGTVCEDGQRGQDGKAGGNITEAKGLTQENGTNEPTNDLDKEKIDCKLDAGTTILPDAGTTILELPRKQGNEKPASQDYATMSLDTLRKIEKVRDASIAWILKQIEKKEKASEQIRSAEERVNGDKQEGRSQEDPE